MLTDSVGYPWNDGENLRALAIGAVLTVLSVLILPAIVLAGYTQRVIRTVAEGDPSPPPWDDWSGLFVDGLRALVVGILYLLVPALFVGGTAIAFFVPFAGEPPRLLTALAVLVALAAVPLVLAAWYALPAGLARVAVTERVGAAFEFRALWPVLRSGTYATAWLSALGVGLAAGVLSSLVSATVVGVVLAPFVSFYAAVAVAYLYGRGFADAVPVETESDRHVSRSPA